MKKLIGKNNNIEKRNKIKKKQKSKAKLRKIVLLQCNLIKEIKL